MSRLSAALVAAALSLTAAACAAGPSGSDPSESAAAVSTAASTGAPTVRVVGNQLVDGAGNDIRLLGVNRSGAEYACAQGWGIFDGPNDDASVAAMASWHINAVRLPLNEACWLGLEGINPTVGGANYRRAIESYVTLLHQHHLMVILDLHVVSPHGVNAPAVEDMADAKHALAFWKSVASAYKDDHSVLFDAYNEPHNISWPCWLHGCSTPGYATAGMQSLVEAIRSAGATQPIMLGGRAYSHDLGRWLANEPKDPDRQLIASVHVYGRLSPCDGSCRATLARVAKKVPVVTGELGETDCKQRYIDDYMRWADAHDVSYLGWTWDAGKSWSCKGGPTLITDYDGTPTTFGVGLENHLAALTKEGLG
jgi:hypothetical protein